MNTFSYQVNFVSPDNIREVCWDDDFSGAKRFALSFARGYFSQHVCSHHFEIKHFLHGILYKTSFYYYDPGQDDLLFWGEG